MPEQEREIANVYTETQHFALLESAVERETATLTTAKSELEATVASLTAEKASVDTELSEVRARIDVLEAEKATADAALEAKTKEFEDFKAELARTDLVETLKTERVGRVKAANTSLKDTYFTTERVQRWAEMADEQFDSLVADMTEAAAAIEPVDKEKERETASFTGGTTPTTVTDGSTVAQFLSARRTPAQV